MKPSVWMPRIAAALLALATLPPTARAQPASNPAHEDAFRRGGAAFQAGDYVDAIAIWENLLQTLGEAEGMNILYNLGLAYEAAGDVTRAVARYETFLAQAAKLGTSGAALDERRRDAEKRLSALKSAHGAMNVLASAGRPVLVKVGAGEPRSAGFTLWLAPGPHVIEIDVGSRGSRTMSVVVKAGETTTIDPTPPEPLPSQRPIPPRPDPVPIASSDRPAPASRDGGPATLTWLFGGAALTIASIALPTALGIRASGKRDDAAAVDRTDPSYDGMVSDFDDARTAYYASFAVPVALAVTTAVVVAVVASRPGKPSEKRGLTGPGWRF